MRPLGTGGLWRRGMAETHRIDREGRRWRVADGRAAPAARALALPPEEASLAVVKSGRGRRVARFEADGRSYYLKAWSGAGSARRLRAALGAGPGAREWRALVAARDAGLPAPEPVALRLGPDEALITVAIEGAERLDEHLFERHFVRRPSDPPYPGARPPELVAIHRRRIRPGDDAIGPHELADALAELLVGLDRAGLYLPDLHPGNLLVARGPGGAWRLWLLDLAEAVRPAPAEALLRHLVRLEHFFEPIATAAERLRVLQRVQKALPAAPRARDVVRAVRAYRRRFYAKRDRRAGRASKYFLPVREAGWVGWAAADWEDAVARLVAAGDPALAPGAAPIKEGRTSSVFRAPAGDGRALVVKRHNRAGEARRPGRSRSMQALARGHALEVRGIATARPAAALDRREDGRLVDTLVMTELVEGVPLNEWLRGEPPAGERHALARRLALALRRLHGAGLAHRDLKAPNILVAGDAADGPRPVLVDLDGLARRRWLTDRRRARDLMRLSVSLDEWGVARATDRLRLLGRYLAGPGVAAPSVGGPRGRELRRWWRRIARMSEAKLARLRAKGTGPIAR